MKIIIGIFIVLHGLVHLFYYGQSIRKFELRPGFEWPDHSWLFSKWLSVENTRKIAGVFCLIAAGTFTLSGVGYFINTGWHVALISISAIFSSLLFLLFWNGKLKGLENQGLIAILINIIIWVVVIQLEL